MQILVWTFFLIGIFYCAGLSVLHFAQRRFVFPIPQTTRTSPQAAGLPQAEEHVLSTSDGEKIILWHVPAKPSHPIILYFPGNGDFLAGRVKRFQKMITGGEGLIAVSYRGYAGSTGYPSEKGLLLDAATAYAFARERHSADNIILWGFSLGSGVATALATESAIRKLILEAPYTSTADVAASFLWFAPVRWLMTDQFRSDLLIGRVEAPLLVMHGDRDPAIPIRFGKRLFALAPEPKQFVRFPEGGHDNLEAFGDIEAGLNFISADNP